MQPNTVIANILDEDAKRGPPTTILRREDFERYPVVPVARDLTDDEERVVEEMYRQTPHLAGGLDATRGWKHGLPPLDEDVDRMEEELAMDMLRLQWLKTKTPDEVYALVKESLEKRIANKSPRELTPDDYLVVMREAVQRDPVMSEVLGGITRGQAPLPEVMHAVFEEDDEEEDSEDEEDGEPLTAEKILNVPGPGLVMSFEHGFRWHESAPPRDPSKCVYPACGAPVYPMQKPAWKGQPGMVCREHSTCYHCHERTEWTCSVCEKCDDHKDLALE